MRDPVRRLVTVKGNNIVVSVDGVPVERRTVKEWDVSQPSRGLGDTVAKITHYTGLDKLAKLYTKTTGKPCGCHGEKGRQGGLNRRYPYKNVRV